VSFFAELQARGLIHQHTAGEGDNAVPHLLDTPGQAAYAGFDPSAKSLHIGNLIPLLGLRRFQLAGHKAIVLAGGATGMVGDPSGKNEERNLLSETVLKENLGAIKGQLERLVDLSDPERGILVDNLDWTKNMTFLQFLRDVGKHFSINAMLRKDSVRRRIGALSIVNLARKGVEELLEDGTLSADEVGDDLAALGRLSERVEAKADETRISYTEFSYMLLQAFDFLFLARRHRCNFQIGGSDQWGNITAGVELIRKALHGRSVHALTFPLLTNSDGSKFGKTAKGAVYLDPELTSPFAFRQFWYNTADADVIQRLKYFTFLPVEEIEALEAEVGKGRAAQQTLAYEMTKLVHGEAEADKVEQAAKILFGKGDLREIPVEYLADAFAAAKLVTIPRARFDGEGIVLLDLVVEVVYEGAEKRGQARRDIEKDTSISINGDKRTDAQQAITAADLLHQRFLVIRKGKKNQFLVEVT
jgi:tyrosyl-tRNA synthetase